MSFYKVSALSVLAISLAACSSSGDKADSQPATTIPSATTGTTGSTNTGGTTNTGNTGTTTPTTPAPTTPSTPVTQPTVLVPAPTAPTGKALEAANKAKVLSIPSVAGTTIYRPVSFDGRINPYTTADKLAKTGEAVIKGSEFKQGFSTTDASYTAYVGGQYGNYLVNAIDRVYHQPYSIVYGTHYLKANQAANKEYVGEWYYSILPEYGVSRYPSYFAVNEVAGLATEVKDIPNAGKATYGGVAFSGTGVGTLQYNVDFATRKGSGVINGLQDVRGAILLNEADLQVVNTAGNAKFGVVNGPAQMDAYKSTDGTYNLGFYGPKAEEVAGSVLINYSSQNTGDRITAPTAGSYKTEIGFGGTRGAITK